VREPPLGFVKITAPRRPVVVAEILRRLVVPDSVRARDYREPGGRPAFARLEDSSRLLLLGRARALAHWTTVDVVLHPPH